MRFRTLREEKPEQPTIVMVSFERGIIAKLAFRLTWESLTSFLSYEQLKPKSRVFFTGSLVDMVTYYVKLINKFYFTIILL